MGDQITHSIIITAHNTQNIISGTAWFTQRGFVYKTAEALVFSGLPAAHIIAASSLYSDKEEAEDHQRAEYQE